MGDRHTPNTPCPGCGVDIGEKHAHDCGVAICQWSGRRRCDCDLEMIACVVALRSCGRDDLADYLGYMHDIDREEEAHACGDDVWRGRTWGQEACDRLGWVVVGPPWMSVEPGTPGAVPDINRLITSATWDRDRHAWIPDDDKGER